MESAMPQLPLYQCHKVVRAAKIESVEYVDQGRGVRLKLEGGNEIFCDRDWIRRNPLVSVGGYFVEYQDGDGYTTYSPAEPFEKGYTLGAGNINLPPAEMVAARVHEEWRQAKLAGGVTSRLSAEDGEELMVPYDHLSDKGKQANRDLVATV